MTVSGTHPDRPAAGVVPDGPFLPHRGDSGATNMPNPSPSPNPSGQDGSGQLRASKVGGLEDDDELVALATVIDPEAMAIDGQMRSAVAMGWMARQDQALLVASAIRAAGYRRVEADDATVERVMWECAAVDDYLPGELSTDGIAYYTAMARAAVQALRDGSGQ